MKIAIYNNGIPFAGDTLARQPLGGSESGAASSIWRASWRNAATR
jgi:hypothetical protein